MSKKVGPLIKEARTNAGYTQQQLADQIDGLSASDISKAERGEKELTQDQLKAIAKATGVTQKSLLEAAAGKSSGKSSGSAGKTGSSGKTSSASSADTSMKLTSAEKKLIELYRAADSDTKKEAVKVLKGDKDSDVANEILSSILGTAMESLLKK